VEFSRYNSANEFPCLLPCLPWYFPSPSDGVKICDPFEAYLFTQQINFYTDPQYCTHCLPDCKKTSYSHTISRLPLSNCDYTNLGVSFFCHTVYTLFLQPKRFADQVKREYSNRGTIPDYISSLESSQRTIKAFPSGDIFTQNPKTYDAYDRDIAVIELFFEKSTVIEVSIFVVFF
jgi:hypothetical protein